MNYSKKMVTRFLQAEVVVVVGLLLLSKKEQKKPRLHQLHTSDVKIQTVSNSERFALVEIMRNVVVKSKHKVCLSSYNS